MEAADFWNDPEVSKKKMKELSKEFYIYEQNRRKMREKRESRK